MLRRVTKIQLVLFVVLTLLGVSYVGAEYVGLAKYVTGDNGCKVSADFPDSGGIFSNAEVTYRGVTVGRVGQLHLIKNGVRVDLNLDSCDSPKIPASTAANVADRSVVGEQYVDLVPPNGKPPFLKAGDNIPMSRNSVPVATQTLLLNLDRFANSVPLDSLRTTVSELFNAFNSRGDDLGNLLDASDLLLKAASDPTNLRATIDLIDQSSSVLQTQLDEQQPLSIWTHNLNLLSQQLKKSDPDVRHLISTGPSDLSTIQKLIQDNQTDLGVTLANLVTVGDLLVRHLPGLEQILELYPALAAGGPTTLPAYTDPQFGPHHYGSLGLVIQSSPTPVPQDCGDINKARQGYDTPVRSPNDTSPQAPNVAARCTAPSTGPDATNVRGSANVPGGDPISISGGGYAYPRVTTQNTLRVGNPLATTATLGDGSWLGMITDALH
jgi:phospholipid/cholesterol/gamma-HCH transport system substrate-binding protein